jgi:hypothetical protein
LEGKAEGEFSENEQLCDETSIRELFKETRLKLGEKIQHDYVYVKVLLFSRHVEGLKYEKHLLPLEYKVGHFVVNNSIL